jgi:hypothetical protein
MLTVRTSAAFKPIAITVLGLAGLSATMLSARILTQSVSASEVLSPEAVRPDALSKNLADKKREFADSLVEFYLDQSVLRQTEDIFAKGG